MPKQKDITQDKKKEVNADSRRETGSAPKTDGPFDAIERVADEDGVLDHKKTEAEDLDKADDQNA